jgi:Putative Ig domain
MAIKYSSIGGGTGTGFNVQIGSKYSYATFTQAQPAGAYTIKSSNNYTNWDVYLLDASNNLVAYTGTASIAPTTAFSAIVVVNGTVNDILQFSFQSTVFSTAENDKTKAGPFITSFGSSSIPSLNNAVTITGGNFAVGITATFTGTDSVVRTCKSVVYTSTTSISVVRPDVLPVAYAPYVLTLTNPGINNPATSGANILTGLTVGNAPTWTTGTSLPAASNGAAYSTTVVATDVEGAVTYSYVSGSLPAGLSFNASTGVISGTYSGLVDGSASYTIRATDNGGNYIDRTFTIAYTGLGGGTLTSDSTYYYRTFTSNGTLTGAQGLVADVLIVAGGAAGGGWGGGGGAGGVVYYQGTTLSSASNTVLVGAGGTNTTGSSYSLGGSGINSSFGTLTAAVGGGGGGYYSNFSGASGGSGGGKGSGDSASYTVGTAAASTQTLGTATAIYGNAGGVLTLGCSWYPGAAGGGGAGAAGGNTSSSGPEGFTAAYGGAGGSGTNAFSSWLTAITSAMTGVSGWSTATSSGYIAGGGGGHSPAGNSSNTNTNAAPAYNAPGGAGGGGRGGNYRATSSNNGTDGVTNTGSGGGGAYGATASPNVVLQTIGQGGSGLVVVRYTRSQVGG